MSHREAKIYSTRPSALGMSDPIMEFQGTPEQPQNNLKIL